MSPDQTNVDVVHLPETVHLGDKSALLQVSLLNGELRPYCAISITIQLAAVLHRSLAETAERANKDV